MRDQDDATYWARVEPISRDADKAETFRAEVHDPLWMLTRQWQLGEFQGEDAGSPVDVSLELAFDELSRYQAVGEGDPPADPEPYDGGPLEALVEREPVLTGRREPNARLAVQGGKNFRRLLDRHAGTDFDVDAFPAGYRLDELTADEDEPVPEEGRRYADVVEGEALDGHRVYLAIDAALGGGSWSTDPTLPWEGDADWEGPSSLPVPSGLAAGDSSFRTAAEAYHEWYDDLYEEPETGESAWDPTRMEYEFRVSTGGAGPIGEDTETVLAARQYEGGRLDWPDFSAVGPTGPPIDVGPGIGAGRFTSAARESDDEGVESLFDGAADAEYTTTRSKYFLPTKVRFKGMPANRYWAFEDADVRLQEIGSDDAASQTLVNFALVYGNDWYSVPVRTPVGSLVRVESLTVTDSFGVTETIGPVEDDEWKGFSVRSPSGDRPLGVFLPPTLGSVIESDAVERVSLSRDEVANLAFAVEQRFESVTGQPLDRDEYVKPSLIVEDTSPAADVGSESVAFRNPGREALDVSGWLLTNGSRAFAFDSGTVLPPQTTLTVHSGSAPKDEKSPTDVYLDAGSPVWHDPADETSVLSVYEPCDVGAHAHSVTERSVTSGSPPLEHLRVRKRIPLRETRALPTAKYQLATDLYDHWFALRPSAEEYAADIPDGNDSDGNRMQYRYRHFLELALVLDAESLDAATIAELPDPEGRILRPYPKDDTRTLRIYTEELHGGGTEVTRRYQLANWSDGSAYLWSGREASTGKGDVGSSNLRYDVLENWTGDDRR